jgi:hypothetical protein
MIWHNGDLWMFEAWYRCPEFALVLTRNFLTDELHVFDATEVTVA